MGRMYVPSTPASRGEMSAEDLAAALSIEELRAQADSQGFDLVEREEVAEEHEPAGNASREEWATYAEKVKGAKPDDLLDDKGEPLGRDALREKYGS